MDDWWSEIDNAILGCLPAGGPMTPREIAGRVGISEQGVTSLLCMLAREGKVRICLVERPTDCIAPLTKEVEVKAGTEVG